MKIALIVVAVIAVVIFAMGFGMMSMMQSMMGGSITLDEPHTSPWGGDQNAFLDSMAEAGKSVSDALEGNIICISVMNNLSIDCDCSANPSQPDIHDIGILASTDPVALDQACVDLIYGAQGNTAFVQRVEGRDAERVLAHAEEIGLGKRSYVLVSIDQ